MDFPGIRKPSINFGDVRNQLRTRPLYFDVDLSTARSLAANTHLVVNISGTFLYIDQRPNTGVASIHFEDINPGSTPVGVFPGALMNVPFTQIAIENVAQPGQSLRLVYGTDVSFLPANGAGVSILNSVSVVDGGKLKTLAGQAFMFGETSGPVAGQYSAVQIWNPAANTKRVILKQWEVECDTAAEVYGRAASGACATLSGNLASKLFGGAVSTAELRIQNSIAAPPVAGNLLYRLKAIANQPAPLYSLVEPIVLNPGQGYVWYAGTLNVQLWVNGEIVEEAT